MRMSVAITLFVLVSLARSASAQVSAAWVARDDGPAHDIGVTTAVAFDGTGNVFVTGQSCTMTDPEYGGCISSDITRIKYGPDGTQLAERVGFEPTVEFPLHTLSKRAPSTTRTSLRVFGILHLRVW
jgi:hypothetical protein